MPRPPNPEFLPPQFLGRELLAALNLAAAQRKITLYEAVEEAIRAYIAKA